MKTTALYDEDENKPKKNKEGAGKSKKDKYKADKPKKNNGDIIKPLVPLPLSQVKNPKELVQKKGDFLLYTKTEKGDDVVKLHADGVKRSAVKYKSTGKIVETLVY